MEFETPVSVNETEVLNLDQTEFASSKASILSADERFPDYKDKVQGLNEINQNVSGSESIDLISGLDYFSESISNATSERGDYSLSTGERRNSILDQRNVILYDTNVFQRVETNDTSESTDRTSIPIKKSILKTPTKSTKKSGLGIQWEEDVKVKVGDESKPGSIYQMSEGGITRPKRIGELMENLKSGKEFTTLGLMDNEGMLRKYPLHELTLDQQVNLEILKQKVKKENEDYLMKHPEISILLKLIYRKLSVHQPKDPNRFVAEYVHHLNIHREELVYQEVDVPFDRPEPLQEPSVSLSVGETVKEKFEFVRRLVENYAELACRGPTYFAVIRILDSVLSAVVPDDTEASDEEQRSSEEIVSSIILTILKSVKMARTCGSELIVEDILEDVLNHIPPTVALDESRYFTVKGSVERFIQSLLEGTFDNAIS